VLDQQTVNFFTAKNTHVSSCIKFVIDLKSLRKLIMYFRSSQLKRIKCPVPFFYEIVYLGAYLPL